MYVSVKKERVNKEDLIVFIPPWHSIEGEFELVKQHIPESFGYLEYKYSDDLLNSDPYSTKKNFLKFIKRVVSDLNKLNRVKERNFYIYTASLGCPLSGLIADAIYIKKMVLIVPGYNLAECFWEGHATKDLRLEMEKKGMTLKKLKKIWKEISMDYSFKKKAKKTQYFIDLTKRDSVIPYPNGKKFVKFLKKKRVKFKVKRGFLPHKILVINDFLFPKRTINFLIK